MFGIKLLDEIDLPEFPFPDLGSLADGEDPPPSAHGAQSRASAADAGAARGARPERGRYH